MELDKIAVIPNTQGLYKIISTNKSGFLLEELYSNKKMAFPITKPINRLKEIIVYTDSQDMTIEEIFIKILEKENSQKVDVLTFSDDDFRSFFQEIIPNYSREHFFISHKKKIIKWYNTLLEHGLISLKKE